MNAPSQEYQVQRIVEGAKSLPSGAQGGVVLDDYKVDFFVRRLGELLPKEEFTIKVLGSPIVGAKLKTLIIKRKPFDPSVN